MKISILAMAAIISAYCGAALAQSAPLRGLGLLALDSSAAPHSFDNAAPGGGGAMLDLPDSGGGSLGAHAARGSQGAGGTPAHRDADPGMTPDALPPKATIPPIDPALPAAPTPRHPSFRWQALVPGAIK